jgi:hypothetical protein
VFFESIYAGRVKSTANCNRHDRAEDQIEEQSAPELR